MPAHSPPLVRACEHCHRPVVGKQWTDRLCPACYQYRRRHGSDRPLRPPGGWLCQQCGQRCQGLIRGRCRPCYQYWHRHGGERPLRRPPPVPRRCAVCGQPTRESRRGRCPTCYMYWYRTGRERRTTP